MQRKHNAAKDWADNRSNAPNSQSPSHARRPNVGRVKRGGQGVRSGLSPEDSCAGKKSARHDEADGMGIAEQCDTRSAKQINETQYPVGPEAVDKAAED